MTEAELLVERLLTERDDRMHAAYLARLRSGLEAACGSWLDAAMRRSGLLWPAEDGAAK